jgi:hypothetical protein
MPTFIMFEGQKNHISVDEEPAEVQDRLNAELFAQFTRGKGRVWVNRERVAYFRAQDTRDQPPLVEMTAD